MVGLQTLILKTLKPKNGSGYTEENVKTVYAKVEDVGIKTRYSAESIGKTVDYTVYLWKVDYRGQTHAVFNGITYKIDVVNSFNDVKVKLLLVRG